MTNNRCGHIKACVNTGGVVSWVFVMVAGHVEGEDKLKLTLI